MIKNRENKSIYTHTVYDSTIEENFAIEFNRNEKVKLFTKLPKWFKINTPLGTYNPDWAVLWDDGVTSKLYFVIETKGTLSWEFLRPTEKGKIECGKKHFEALGDDIRLEVANSYDSFVDVITGK
jgi:type III restriction enzyme